MRRQLAIVLALGIVASACGSSETAGTTPPDGQMPTPAAPGTPAPAADEESDDPAIPDPPEPAGDEAVPAMPATLVPGCTAKSTLGGHPAWFFFSRPDKPCEGTAKDLDPHAVNELVRLIASVPKGGRIDGHIFSISVDAVGKALLDAQTRGVDVWISTDGAVASLTDPSKVEYLDKLVHKVYCTSANRTSCISTAR